MIQERYVWEPLIVTEESTVSKSPWGEDDQIGRLNWITEESQAAVLSRIKPGRTFDLSVDLFMGMPAWLGSGDPKYDIWMTHTPRGTVIDTAGGISAELAEKYSYCGDAVTMYTHTGTHMDMLNHFGYHGRFWNGWDPNQHLGSRHWIKGGPENYPNIVARGIVLDVARHHGVACLPDSYVITAKDCIDTAAAQGTNFQKGDIVMIRTGRMTKWPNGSEFADNSPGIGLEAARFLCEDAGAMVIGGDNDSLEVDPSDEGTYFPVHSYMFATAGAPIIESLWLEEIAEARVYEVAFMGGPMKLSGATGSPMRPMAIPLR